MRTVFVIPDFRADTPTHFHYIYELVRAIAQNADIFLIIEKGDSPDFLPKNKFYVQKFRFLPLRIIENLSVIFYARALGYKDFYIHYSFLSAFNSSLVVKIFGGRTFYWNCGLPWLYQRNFLRDSFERSVYRLVTFLVTGTEKLKNQYAEHYHLPLMKIKVMPNWVDVNRFSQKSGEERNLKLQLNIPESAKIILFVHHLSKRKGAHYLPEIVKLLRDENVVLLIAGEGPEQEKLKAESERLKVSDMVRFLGCVPNKEIQNYFGIADVFILPSEEEGFPHVLLEAMAASVPFVAFDVGGVREIIPPEFIDYLVPKNEIAIFSNKIKELLNKEAKDLADLKQSELSWVRQFDIYNASRKFQELLTNVAE